MLTQKCQGLLRPCGRFLYSVRSNKTKTRPQFTAQLQGTLQDDLKNKKIPPRKHPGAFQHKVIELPPKQIQVFEAVLLDHPPKKVAADGKVLERYLKGRHVPLEESKLKMNATEIKNEVETQLDVDVSKLTEEQFDKYKKLVERRVNRILKYTTYAWKPIDYDEYQSRVYLLSRALPEYTALFGIMKEIKMRDPEFKPRSFFDFGSGVGTGTWAAADHWKQHLYEYFCVDSSPAMNDLAELILKGGKENKERKLKEVYYRQFLGAPTTSYDIVLSAFSLIELPNRKTRLEVLTNLWTRCSGYLILAELGTNAGFELIIEARNFIMKLKGEDGHLFAPCPHELACPRVKIADKTPCNFEFRYQPLPLGVKRGGDAVADKISYVVFRKGPQIDEAWPRLVRPTLVRTRHCFCRLCTEKGALREIIVTPKKHGKEVYHCARSSRWGDRLPMIIENVPEDKELKNRIKPEEK